ncbi:hypothetical protein [Bacteroides stercorirosoris]|uniref:hypothetical protein n=1 Tax=Bacteroides stercorirosoris TaxID=871324 RepID=UPI0005541AC1|nr:hypothetical protein [Bacteroides stercorirosoris]
MTENRENELIEKIINIELLNGLNELYVEDIPLWHIIRYRMRGYYFLRNGINDISSGSRSKFKLENIRYFFISFFQFIRLFFIKVNPKVCFFGFTRLESVNGFYIDKFIDPIISEIQIKESDFYILIINIENIPFQEIMSMELFILILSICFLY